MPSPSQTQTSPAGGAAALLSNRRRRAAILALAACGLMAGAAVCFRPATAGGLLGEGAALMLLGGGALGLALRTHSRAPASNTRQTQPTRLVADAEPPAATDAPPNAPRLLRDLPLALGLLALAALIEMNGPLVGIAALRNAPLRLQFLTLVAAVALTTWGLARSGGGARLRRARALRLELLVVAAITALALGLRLWHLGDAVHKFVDEIHFSTAVMGVLPGTNPLRLLEPFAGITAFPWLYPYWQAETAAIFGRTLFSLRLISALLGAFTIPALYLLARTLFDRPTAAAAALLLATFPPHLHFSRIGLNNVADPLFGTLALAFLARALRGGRRFDYAAAGAALGLTQYFYEGGRLLFPPLAGLWLLALALPRWLPARWRGFFGRGEANWHFDRRGLATFALAAVLIGLPVYTTLLATGKPVIPRMETVAVGGSYWQRVVNEGTPQTIPEHLLRPFLVYVHMPETALFYGGDQALVIEQLVPALLLGAFGLLWRWRSLGGVALLWALLASAGNMLMTESAIYARYVVAFPAVALLLAMGLRCTLPLLLPRRAGLAAMIGLAGLMSAAQTAYYFGHHLTFYNWQIRPTYDSEDAMFRAAQTPPGTQIHVISAASLGHQYLSGVMGYLRDSFSLYVIPPADLTADYVAKLSPALPHVFVLEPQDVPSLTLLQRYFDLGEPQFSPYNVPRERQYVMFYVPGDPAASAE